MLSFKAYLTEKKSKVLINPKKDDLKEVKKEHGEDCDCMKCEKDRRKNDVNDGPDVQNEAAPLAGLAKAGAVIAKGAKVAAKVGKVAKKAGKVAGVAASVGAGVGAAMSSSNSNNNSSSTVDEAKVDQGRSDYGKASIRNYRRMGPGHGDPGMFDPSGKRGKTIDKRREEHKARRGVKGAKVPTYTKEETVDEAKSAAWQRKEGKRESGGLNQKGVDSYRAANPGSKLKTAVTTKPSKLKKGSKSASRRKSFCARMGGMKKKLTSAKTANDPDSRINKSLRKWNCSYEPDGTPIMEADKAFNTVLAALQKKHGKENIITKKNPMKPQSAADKAKARAHQAKVDKENAAERKKDPSQGRYPKG